MKNWVSVLVMCLAIGWGMTARAIPALINTEGVAADHFDWTCTVTPQAPVLEKGGLVLMVTDTKSPVENSYSIALAKDGLTIAHQANRKRVVDATIPFAIQPGVPSTLTILRRGEWLGVLHGDTELYRGAVPYPAGKLVAAIQLPAHWTVEHNQLISREPVAFADDFMRTADEPGQWKIVRGQWALQSAWDSDARNSKRRFDLAQFAQNPFAWVGRAPGGSALCTAGQPAWDDYTFTAAVRPTADGAVGLAFNMRDPDHGFVVRWSAVTDNSDGGNHLRLCQLDGSRLVVLAEVRGGFLPGQWYRLAVVSSMNGVRVLIDGHERLIFGNLTPWHGGVGLYAEGDGGLFDDVTVYGRALKTDLLAERRLARFNERFKEDHKGMAEWSTVQSDWMPFPAAPNFQLHRLPFYGDHWLTLPVKVDGTQAGTLTMILDGDGATPEAGYRAVLQQAAGKGTLTATLYRGVRALATKTLPALHAGEEYTVRCRREDRRFSLDLDGDLVLSAEDATPLPGHQTAYAATGAVTRSGEALALGHHLLDYSFADAPVDWLADGTWMPTNRWSCSSQWSFLGGWSPGDAVLWHKDRFAGDQLFEAYVAEKMEYPRQRRTYWADDRFSDYALTICGDGHDPRSGYAGIFAAARSVDAHDRRTVLLRNGVEVGSVLIPPPDSGLGHTAWYHLQLFKHGAVVELWVNGARAVTFTDPAPIDGGVPAVWTTDNGIAVARARLCYANPPVARVDPRVTIDDPGYPTWANVGQPLTLDFPHACSSSGQPVTLAVTARQAPAAEPALPAVKGTRVTFTPRAPGTHWYQITARDGAVSSPAFHLLLPAFTPSLGRDDTHAVVLYRFDEGRGTVVKDHGAGAPADLVIPATAPVAWKSGQGLWVHGPGPIQTAGGVAKLMALAEKKAATIELWLDADTLYTPTDWVAGLLAWELPHEQRNFAIAQYNFYLAVATPGVTFEPSQGSTFTHVMRTGLLHVVVTWDGTLTRYYVNGDLKGTVTRDWQPTRWSAAAPLLLGSLAEGQPNYHDRIARFLGPRPDILANAREMNHCYLGTFYLAAVHDKCFTDEEVKRHYQAGPSAR